MNPENSADFFYYYMRGENLPENHSKNKVEELTKFKARIHWYFDAELSTTKMLCEYLCDFNGNENKTFFVVEELINNCFKAAENISNTAGEVFINLTRIKEA